MAITHTFRGGKDPYGYGYYGYIEDNQLVLGETWPHEGGETYRGTYTGAEHQLEKLKLKARQLYDDIEKYFTLHDPDILCSGNPTKAGELTPGDKFKRKGNEYLMIDFLPSQCFVSGIFSNFVCAVDLSTYKVICLDKDWEVEPIN